VPGGLEGVLEEAMAGDLLALGRLARALDDDEPGAVDLVYQRLYARGGKAHVVGVTGPPGAGKSTVVNRLISAGRSAGLKVCVLAVDPTSPFTGGALLGDRIRMQEHAGDPGVFVRSLGTRGHRGGLSRSVPPLLTLFDAAGYGLLILETVGVGQDEVEVAGCAHTVLLVTQPGTGDAIQSMKAGVLEIAHIYLVNKADLPGADRAQSDLSAMVALSPPRDGWSAPVLAGEAATGRGMDEVFAALGRHREHLFSAGLAQRTARARAERELRDALRDALLARAEERIAAEPERLEDDLSAIFRRELDPRTAARRWLS
jgi:LAO/AO transport system kinase